MKMTQMSINRDYLFSLCHSKGISHHHLGLAEMQRQLEEWESFTGEKEKAPGAPSSKIGKPFGRLTRS